MGVGERVGWGEDRGAGRGAGALAPARADASAVMGARAGTCEATRKGTRARSLMGLVLSLSLAVACVCSLGACASLDALVPGTSREATLVAGITDHTWTAVPSGGGIFTFDAHAGRYTSWRYADKVGDADTDHHDGTYQIMLDGDAAAYVEDNYGADGSQALSQLDRLSRVENSEVHYILLVLNTEGGIIDGVRSKERRCVTWEGVWYVDQGRLNLTNINSYNEYDFYAEFVPEDERRSPSSRFLENTLDMLNRDDQTTSLSS